MHSSGANRRKQMEASPPTPQSNGDKSICESIFPSARVRDLIIPSTIVVVVVVVFFIVVVIA